MVVVGYVYFELIKNEWNELPTNVVFGALNLLNYNFSMFIGCITSWLIENPAKEIWNQVTSPIFAKKNTPRGNSCEGIATAQIQFQRFYSDY